MEIKCLLYTGLPTKDQTVKTTQNSKNMTSWSSNFGFCIQLSILIVYLMIKPKISQFWPTKNPECKKIRTVVFRVSSFVGPSVYINRLRIKHVYRIKYWLENVNILSILQRNQVREQICGINLKNSKFFNVSKEIFFIPISL